MKGTTSVVTLQAIQSLCKLTHSSRINGRKLETQNNNLFTFFTYHFNYKFSSVLYILLEAF